VHTADPAPTVYVACLRIEGPSLNDCQGVSRGPLRCSLPTVSASTARLLPSWVAPSSPLPSTSTTRRNGKITDKRGYMSSLERQRLRPPGVGVRVIAQALVARPCTPTARTGHCRLLAEDARIEPCANRHHRRIFCSFDKCLSRSLQSTFLLGFTPKDVRKRKMG